jgi:hypothetical protein
LPGWVAAAELPQYKVGDTALEDIVTPYKLVVENPEETQEQREAAAGRIAVICRYYTNAVDQSEAEFRLAFATTRSNFLDKLEETFSRRELDAAALTSTNFLGFVATIHWPNHSFPVNTNLAQIWARGESGAEIEASWLDTLRKAAAQIIRPPNISSEVKFGSNVRLVPISSWAERLTLEKVDARGTNVSKAKIITASRLRENLTTAAPPEDQDIMRFMLSFIKTNCIPDEEATRQARVRRADPLWSAAHYEPGQLIVKKGQLIDSRTKAAVDQLREKSANAKVEQELQSEILMAQQARHRAHVVEATSIALLLSLILLVWRFSRRAQSQAVVPARVAGTGAEASVISCPSCDEKIIIPSTGVQPASNDLRSRVAPHLARLLMNKLVRHLLWQRTSLLDTQEQAASDMAELESRLQKVNAPLQERLRAYEERIGELEKELAQKGEENRELIRLKIQLMRKELAAAKSEVGLN